MASVSVYGSIDLFDLSTCATDIRRICRYLGVAFIHKGSTDPLPLRVVVAYRHLCRRVPDERAEGAVSTRKGAYIVEITPQDVQKKQFERVKRGFDPQQVGDFLERMAAALAARDRELHEARTEIEALARTVTDVKQNEEAFRLTMTAATEAKEEMLRRAREEAHRIEEEARRGAEVVTERARVEAESHIVSVKHEIQALEGEKARLELQLDELQASAATVHESLDSTGAGQEAPGRPPLELVVDQGHPAEPTPDAGLAARVGDLRA